MGPGHHHPHGAHGDGFGPWWMLTLLLMLFALVALARTVGVDGLRELSFAGPRTRWRMAVTRHREVAAAFAAYECDAQAVWRRPALADVRRPATARFVEAFAEACALATDRYPGRRMAELFSAAVDRSARAWAAADRPPG